MDHTPRWKGSLDVTALLHRLALRSPLFRHQAFSSQFCDNSYTESLHTLTTSRSHTHSYTNARTPSLMHANTHTPTPPPSPTLHSPHTRPHLSPTLTCRHVQVQPCVPEEGAAWLVLQQESARDRVSDAGALAHHVAQLARQLQAALVVTLQRGGTGEAGRNGRSKAFRQGEHTTHLKNTAQMTK